MSDGRHFDKTEKSEYLRNSLIDYHKILHIDAKAPYTQLKVRLKKNPRRRIAGILKNRHNSAMVLQIAMKFGTITQFDPLNSVGR